MKFSWLMRKAAAALCVLTLCGAAFADVPPDAEGTEPVLSDMQEIPSGPLAVPLSVPHGNGTETQAASVPQPAPVAQPEPPDRGAAPQAFLEDIARLVSAPVAGGEAAAEVQPLPEIAPPAAPDGYDPMNTLLALNMAVVSVRHMTASADRIILDQEYNRIINNLKLGSIENDPEIVSLYSRLLDTISTYQLTEDESKVFSRVYDEQQRRAMTSALANLRPRGGDLESFFASLFSSGVSAYFGYRDKIGEVRRAMDVKTWELQKEALEALNGLQKELLSDSWALLRKYNLPDSGRITQEDLDLLEQALQQPDRKKALQMYSVLQDAFSAYPPFWFYWAQAAERCGEIQRALSCLDEFERIHRPVLRRDPYLAEAAKMRIVLDRSISHERLMALLAQMRDNISPRDWPDNLFYGAQSWAAGDRAEGMAAVRNNILFETETRISETVLDAMQKDNFNSDEFRSAFQIAAGGIPAGPPALAILADWFGGYDSDAMRRAQSAMSGNSPVPYFVAAQILRRSAEVKSDRTLAEAFEKKHASLVERNGAAYTAVLDYTSAAAGQGRARAQFLLGCIYENGWGVMRDPFQAAKWLRLAAGQGDDAAQTAYASLCERGAGVTRDASEAARWYALAAKQDNDRAQYELGRMYRLGTGVNRDLVEAARNFLSSARAGYAPAQADLGELYRKGAGVPKDYAESYKWSWLAKLNGDKSAQANLNVLDGRGVLRGAKVDAATRERAKKEAQKLYNETHGKNNKPARRQ